MTKNNCFKQYANYLIIFSVCIDQGDGRWKERDKKNLSHEIMVFKIAEKLEHEIEAFYDEYPDERQNRDNIDRIHYKYLTNLLNRNTETTKGSENKDREKHIFSFATRASVNKKTSVEKVNTVKPSELFTIENKSNNDLNSNLHWPKFEDILLAIGRKYDWKNDKWIKVTQKPKTVHVSNEIMETQVHKVDFHNIHKFSYRIVKLNRSKSRRNVVVAVSAVR